MTERVKSGTFAQAVRNNWYVMGLAWQICPGRVLASGIHFGLVQFEYLFFSGFFLFFCLMAGMKTCWCLSPT